MSDVIKHECGIAVIRLRKPLSYYIDKYGSPTYGMNKLYLLMEKQHNRGQDGAGVANIKIDQKPGQRYISRYRSIDRHPISAIFSKIGKKYQKAKKEGKEKYYDERWLKENCAFTGEVWLGHLRYGTYGKNSIESCHPILRQNNWRSRSLVMAGNFNMTNVDELFNILLDLGQHPKEKVDTVTVLEKIGHFLDEGNQAIFRKYKKKYSKKEITLLIENELDLQKVLRKSCKDFDGGYAMAGLTGYGAAFIARDPAGIRPAYYYADDEVVVVASEKPAIKTAFNVEYDQIHEIERGHALPAFIYNFISSVIYVSNQFIPVCVFGDEGSHFNVLDYKFFYPGAERQNVIHRVYMRLFVQDYFLPSISQVIFQSINYPKKSCFCGVGNKRENRIFKVEVNGFQYLRYQ